MLVIPCCCAYVMTALLGRHAGRVVAIVSLGYLLKCHVVQDSLLWRRGDIDNSGTMMLLVLKMITVAYCVSDGIKFKSKKDAPRNDRLRAIADGQMRRSLHAMPGPIAYFGYLFNCGSCLCGPYHEIGDYAAWTEARGEWAPGSNFYASRRSRWRAAGIALCKLSACVVLHLIIDAKVKPHTVNETQTGVLGKVGLAHLVCLSARMRFYFVWILGELGGILSGLAYTADGTWSRLRNQDILGIEFCTSCAMLPIGWNIQVSLWLRHYAYERYLQHGIGSDAAVLLTQLVSTIWHGVYPGYLIFFVTSALCIQASKLIHRRTSGLRGTSKSMLQPFLYLLTQIQNSCAGVRFHVTLAVCVCRRLARHTYLPKAPIFPLEFPMIHSECAFFFLLLLLITWTHVRSLSLCVCVVCVCVCPFSIFEYIYIYICDIQTVLLRGAAMEGLD